MDKQRSQKRAGEQINLDKGEAQILQGKIIDDIRMPCASLKIVFECSNKLNFTPDDQCYFTYKDYHWIPTVVNEGLSPNNTWHYEMNSLPVEAFQLITKPAEDTMILARAMGLQLTTSSSSLKIPCPIINYYSSLLIQEIRRQSFNRAYINRQMGDAYFIYFDSNCMYSVTWKQLVNQKARSLENYEIVNGQNTVKFIDERIQAYFASAVGSEVWKQPDYLNKMFGRKIQIHTTTPAVFANMYTIRFTDTDALDQEKSFLCIKSECDINEANGFINTFAEVNYIEKEKINVSTGLNI